MTRRDPPRPAAHDTMSSRNRKKKHKKHKKHRKHTNNTRAVACAKCGVILPAMARWDFGGHAYRMAPCCGQICCLSCGGEYKDKTWQGPCPVCGVAKPEHTGIWDERIFAKAEEGLLWAQSMAASILHRGDTTLPRHLGGIDQQGAIALMEKSAAGGHPVAQYNLGMVLRDGLGVAPDPARTLRLWKQSAELGLPPAQVDYALVLQEAGKLSEALAFFEKAAMQDDIRGMSGCANVYSMQQNDEMAVVWWAKLAGTGNAPIGVLFNLFAVRNSGTAPIPCSHCAQPSLEAIPCLLCEGGAWYCSETCRAQGRAAHVDGCEKLRAKREDLGHPVADRTLRCKLHGLSSDKLNGRYGWRTHYNKASRRFCVRLDATGGDHGEPKKTVACRRPNIELIVSHEQRNALRKEMTSIIQAVASEDATGVTVVDSRVETLEEMHKKIVTRPKQESAAAQKLRNQWVSLRAINPGPNGAENADDPCPICQDPLPKWPHEKARMTCCGNFVCFRCSDAWGNSGDAVAKTCCLCRAPVQMRGSPENHTQVLEKAEAGFAWAQHLVAQDYLYGHAVHRSVDTAKAWLDKSAGAGWYLAQHELGDLLLRSDTARAMQLYQASAETGYHIAQVSLALVHYNGCDGEYPHAPQSMFSRERASYWLTKAGKVGNPQAAEVLQITKSRDDPMHCSRCGKYAKGMRRCGGCKGQVWYCGPACQKQDYASHKILCRMVKKHGPIYGGAQ